MRIRTVVCGFILILLFSGAVAGDLEESAVRGLIEQITLNYASVGDVSRLEALNSNLYGPGDDGADRVTLSPGPFTVYLLTRGWIAAICNPGENPNVFGSACFVDDDVRVNETIKYSTGILETEPEVSSVSFQELGRTVNMDNERRAVTLSVHLSVNYSICTSSNSTESEDTSTLKDEDNRPAKYGILRLDDASDSEDSEDEDDGGSSCSYGNWNGWISQTIPAPENIMYNRNVTINVTNLSWVDKANSSLFQEVDYGFELVGYIQTYSLFDGLENLTGSPLHPKKENISVKLSWFEDYYEIVWNKQRQIYVGVLAPLKLSPPNIDSQGIIVFYNSSNGSTFLNMPKNANITKVTVLTQFGAKELSVNIREQSAQPESAVYIAVLLTGLGLFAYIVRWLFF